MRIIMGIDPGTSITGYGLIKCEGKKMELIGCGIIKLGSSKISHPDKLKRIFERINGLIKEFHPTEMALEAPFYGNNVQSMLKLGRAQGVAIAAAISRSMPIFEYAPRKIKLAITGSGNASKEQVAGILQNMFKMKELPKQLDATDGLAAAVCHHYQKKITPGAKSANSWKDFVSKNPDRVK